MLVEDNLDDEVLSLRVMNKVSSTNQVIVVDGGAEALDDLFGTGAFASRQISDLPLGGSPVQQQNIGLRTGAVRSG